jgi:hypothetical protein
LAARAKGYTPNLVLVTLKQAAFFAMKDIPNPHALIVAGRGKPPALCVKSQEVDPILVALKLNKLLIPRKVPDPDYVIITYRHELPAVSAEPQALKRSRA